ncbi:type II toxin-antitoxin system VapC family toxin [Nostocaceae cyanobacterium CENA369]|uniref:Type II toxin-antitoxin system VapC family toxin n=1 Tax=Dendronalium phyllosphericum CENA369 TaxID=1725256 RepID=A0A8J7I5X6_9NOST|nr:type II toxin-antitoxin system VapC family toxin [Dendronalium phyllosphericum]MBH8576615.1 type II toxin-antitoxin system VapC family toxin [Dendronalium phyllosphericum CENA369]
MELLLDSCALIWSLEDNPYLSPEARLQISDPLNNVFVSAASVGEIEIKRKKGQLKAPDNLLEAIINTQFSFLRITEHHAVKAASLPEHHKDPFDRLLIAQAILEKMVIITSDTAFIKYGVSI